MMEAKPAKHFPPKGGKKLALKDSPGKAVGIKPGGKKPIKPYINKEMKGKLGKSGNNNTKHKLAEDQKGPKKKKFPVDKDDGDSPGKAVGIKPGGKKPVKPYIKKERKGKLEKSADNNKKHTFAEDGKGPNKRTFPVDKDDGAPQAKKFKKGKFKPERQTDEELKNRLQKKKDLKMKRQQASRKDKFEIINQAKLLWGDLRVKKCDRDLKNKLMKALHELFRGKYKEMAFAHDTTRMLECFIQFGSHEQRQEVFEATKDDILLLSKSRYGRNVVKKLLMYGNKELVGAVIQTFKGHVRVMLRHALASSIIEDIYTDKALPAQKQMLKEELYGTTYTVCKSSVCDTVHKVVEANPDKRNFIINDMQKILTPMAQKEQVIKNSLVHKVFLDFFLLSPDKQRAEMIESIRESVIYMAHTHAGARVAMHCLWHGTAKDRKVIIKTMRTYMVKVATEEFSHLALLAMFDCVDDTRLIKQAVLSEIMSSLDEVVDNKYGKKVLLYLLTPRDPAHLLPEIIKVLEQGDGNAHSKKDKTSRWKELLEFVSPLLLDYLHNNAAKMAMSKASSVLVKAILAASACGDLRPAMTAVAHLANQKLIPGGIDGEFHMAEHPAGHIVLKWLIEQDVMLAKAGREECFARILVDTVDQDNLKTWVQVNRGTVVLCSLLKSCDQTVVAEVKAALHFFELDSNNSSIGAQILMSNLKKIASV
ncbi:pumilio homolog 3 [Nerophis ophidion]|uniref:pumilio homolog 3 n=1 Tax=Nerophis ophidion TaxID=159077 RepID=UPI002AE0973C|nr:pumilio homolog 3 [Nerophis ophidion]